MCHARARARLRNGACSLLGSGLGVDIVCSSVVTLLAPHAPGARRPCAQALRARARGWVGVWRAVAVHHARVRARALRSGACSLLGSGRRLGHGGSFNLIF